MSLPPSSLNPPFQHSDLEDLSTLPHRTSVDPNPASHSNTSSLRDYLCNKLLGFGEASIRCLDAWCVSNLRSKHHRGCQVSVWFPWFWSSPPLINPNTKQTGQLRMEKTLNVLVSRSFLWYVYYIFTGTGMYMYILYTMIKNHTFRTGAYNTGWFQFL